MQAIVILVTSKDVEEAETIASYLLQEKLIACANIVENVRSLFWWEGKIAKANEALLIIKTNQNLLEKIIKAVQSIHSYEVPEVIALPIVGGNPKYLEWLNESVR